METLITYKFYDERKRRLSIFGEFSAEKKGLVITVFTCSKKDNFSKKEAKSLYDLWKTKEEEMIAFLQVHPQEFIVPCEENKMKEPFMSFCKTHFYKMEETVAYMSDVFDITNVKVVPYVTKGILGRKGQPTKIIKYNVLIKS